MMNRLSELPMESGCRPGGRGMRLAFGCKMTLGVHRVDTARLTGVDTTRLTGVDTTRLARVRAKPQAVTLPAMTRVGAVAPEQQETRILDTVRRFWGFDRLWPLQREAIQAGLERRDSMVVMPTGRRRSPSAMRRV